MLANDSWPQSFVTYQNKQHKLSVVDFRSKREREGLDLNSQQTDRAGERLAVILQKSERTQVPTVPLCFEHKGPIFITVCNCPETHFIAAVIIM